MGQTTTSSQHYFSFPRYAAHNPWLDALRALAVLLVLFRHGIKVHRPSEESAHAFSTFWQNVCLNGWIGVDLFFVLSGFLISRILLRRLETGHKIFNWRYFEDRILRIVPAYFAVLCLCVAGFFPGFLIAPEHLEMRFVYHLLFLQDYLGSNINVVFWSLGVEEKFYILVPVFIWGIVKLKSLGAKLSLCGMFLLLSPLARFTVFSGLGEGVDYDTFFPALRSPFHMSLDCFIIGIMAAILQKSGHVLSAKTSKYVLALSLLGLLLLSGSHEFLARITLYDAVFQPLLLSFIFGAIVLSALGLADIGLPCEGVFRIKARLSYTLYLVHFPLIPIALVLAGGAEETGLNMALFWAVYFAISFGGAACLHFFVEKPFLIFKQRRAAKRTLLTTPHPILGL